MESWFFKALFILFIVNISFSSEKCDVYRSSPSEQEVEFQLNEKRHLIIFNKVEFNEQGMFPPFNYQVKASVINCDTGEKKFVDNLPYMGKPSVVADVHVSYKSGFPVIFIIAQFPVPAHAETLPYNSDWFMVLKYNYNGFDFVEDKRRSFFGDGVDIIDIKSNELIYAYPYKSKEAIKRTYFSDIYIKWKNHEIIEGKIIKKTVIQNEANYSDNKTPFLIEGDKFLVRDIFAGWLLVDYENLTKRIISGWIMCKDTSICQKAN